MKKSELRQIIREEISNMDNGESYERMEGLINQNDLKLFIQSASKIMQYLTNDGFETKDVYKFLYNQMLNNV